MPSSDRRDRVVIPFAVGDLVTLRKPHPCGSSTWKIYRVGADIGLLCQGCGRRVMLERPLVQRRTKSRIPASAENDASEPTR